MNDDVLDVVQDVIPLVWRQRVYAALGIVAAVLTAIAAGFAAVHADAPDALVAALAVVVSLTGPASLMSRVYARPAAAALTPVTPATTLTYSASTGTTSAVVVGPSELAEPDSGLEMELPEGGLFEATEDEGAV